MNTIVDGQRRAFAGCPRPAAGDITRAGCRVERDELRDWLGPRTRDEVLAELAGSGDDPDLPRSLEPAAFRYFTPAYLIAAMSPGPSVHAERRLVAPTHALAPDRVNIESLRIRYLPAFSPAERDAIARSLVMVARRDTDEALAARARIDRALREIRGRQPT